ncbi:CU044_5270 family protein [Actinomadura sp. 21ATH]|uniref:CU044_5270 family protein n=1 Tax=Actinomadura sp. 21ATH TaxID=1735444 RepID=UPI0035BEE347
MKPHPTDEPVRTLARVRDADLAGHAARPAARELLTTIMTTAPADATVAAPGPAAADTATARVAASDAAAGGGAGARVRRRGRSLAVRLAVAGTAAAAVATGVAVWPGGGGESVPPAAPPVAIRLASAAEAGKVLDRAAAAARNRPSAAPGPRQWVYTRIRVTSGARPAGSVTGGPYRTDESELWRRGDGRQYAAYENGRISVGRETAESARASRYLPLPTDPGALFRKIHGSGGGGPLMTFETLVTILRENVHPPATEAAIYRAMKLVPGVTLVEGGADAAGRPAIALGVVDQWTHTEVLLDPETYGYLGDRVFAVKDHEVDGGSGERVLKGTLQHQKVRVAVKVVDRPGARS